MDALRFGAILAVVMAGLTVGLLLGTAGPAYPAPQAQSYCLDALDDAGPRRLGDQSCRPNPVEQWPDAPEHLVPAHPEARDA